MFNESLEESGETDVSYRNQKLKNRLKKTFGIRIGFWHPRNRWESEVVLCDDVQKRELIEAGSGSSTKDNEFNIDNTEDPDARQHESLRYVYHSATCIVKGRIDSWRNERFIVINI